MLLQQTNQYFSNFGLFEMLSEEIKVSFINLLLWYREPCRRYHYFRTAKLPICAQVLLPKAMGNKKNHIWAANWGCIATYATNHGHLGCTNAPPSGFHPDLIDETFTYGQRYWSTSFRLLVQQLMIEFIKKIKNTFL